MSKTQRIILATLIMIVFLGIQLFILSLDFPTLFNILYTQVSGVICGLIVFQIIKGLLR